MANPTNDASAIERYADKESDSLAAVCRYLEKEIRRTLPKATARIWHSMPVWFVGDDPVVGYKSSGKNVNLLFWNGQAFNEPGLKAAGKHKAAQIQFTDVTQIDQKALRRWIEKAGKEIWDYAELRSIRTG